MMASSFTCSPLARGAVVTRPSDKRWPCSLNLLERFREAHWDWLWAYSSDGRHGICSVALAVHLDILQRAGPAHHGGLVLDFSEARGAVALLRDYAAVVGRGEGVLGRDVLGGVVHCRGVVAQVALEGKLALSL